MTTKLRTIDAEITRRKTVKVTGERLYTQAEVQAMLAAVMGVSTPATPAPKTASKPAVKPMSAKREAAIRAELTQNWHDLVALRKREGREAEYASPLQARKAELKAELKAAGKHTRITW